MRPFSTSLVTCFRQVLTTSTSISRMRSRVCLDRRLLSAFLVRMWQHHAATVLERTREIGVRRAMGRVRWTSGTIRDGGVRGDGDGRSSRIAMGLAIAKGVAGVPGWKTIVTLCGRSLLLGGGVGGGGPRVRQLPRDAGGPPRPRGGAAVRVGPVIPSHDRRVGRRGTRKRALRRTPPDPPVAETGSPPARGGLEGAGPLLLSPGVLPPAGRLVWRSAVGSTGRERARESPLYRLVDAATLRSYCESGPPVSPGSMARCGRWSSGCSAGSSRAESFLMASRGCWCPTCRTSVLCPFSCRGRSFCPSCEKKRQLLWAEWLQKEVLAPVPHRHLVLTMPRLLRGIFRKRRELLLDLSQCAAEAVAEYVGHDSAQIAGPVSSSPSRPPGAWSRASPRTPSPDRWAFSNDGAFHALENWDAEAVMKRFRERLLARLVERHAISEDLARKLVAWKHPGFSSHIAEGDSTSRTGRPSGTWRATS